MLLEVSKILYSEPKHLGLPVILDSTSLATLLDLSGCDLYGLLKAATRVEAGTAASLYKEFNIPKSGGGVRVIYAPTKALKAIQYKIRDRILDFAPKEVHSVAYETGSRPGDTAELVSGAPVIIKVDIKNYFPSILQKWVKEYFVHLGYSEDVSNLLGGLLCVYAGGRRFVPQGGPTSPMLANRIAEWRIDPEILSVLPEGWEYRRYCDNLYIWPKSEEASSIIPHGDLLNEVKKALFVSGFRGHQAKIVPSYKSQRLLGLTVNSKANMPREKYRKLRACLHNCASKGFASQMQEAHSMGFKIRFGINHEMDIQRFKMFLLGLMNYYKHFLVPARVQKLEADYEKAVALESQ